MSYTDLVIFCNFLLKFKKYLFQGNGSQLIKYRLHWQNILMNILWKLCVMS